MKQRLPELALPAEIEGPKQVSLEHVPCHNPWTPTSFCDV